MTRHRRCVLKREHIRYQTQVLSKPLPQLWRHHRGMQPGTRPRPPAGRIPEGTHHHTA